MNEPTKPETQDSKITKSEIGIYIVVGALIFWMLFRKAIIGDSYQGQLVELLILFFVMTLLFFKSIKKRTILGNIYNGITVLAALNVIIGYVRKDYSLFSIGLLVFLISLGRLKDEYLSWRIKGYFGIIVGVVLMLLGVFVFD